MVYKVFLVEDEIVTREGIRENVDWHAAGCEFCGEAPDGEAALALIETTRPDILITDIKMPFMDGLQLSKIINKHMPWTKVIILSGHDEFEYAQKALQVGVTEYLLKPITSEDIHQALTRVTQILDRELEERRYYSTLREKAAENLATQRERFLLRLLMGGLSSTEAIERSQSLGYDLISPYYQVFVLKLKLTCDGSLFDFQVYEQVESLINEIVTPNGGVLVTKNGLDQYMFILTGANETDLRENTQFWSHLIKQEIIKKNICKTVTGFGSIQQRPGDLHLSFAEALIDLQQDPPEPSEKVSLMNVDHVQYLKSRRKVLENFLKFGDIAKFESFKTDFFINIPDKAIKSNVFRNFLMVDILLTIIQFLNDLDPEREYTPPVQEDLEKLIGSGITIDGMMEEIEDAIIKAISIRDNSVQNEQLFVIQKAKKFIDENFSSPELQMQNIAKEFNISSGYFSTLFSQKFGRTFREYLKDLRLDHAMELLRTTNARISEIAVRCGYNDTHYFSTIFKQNIGFTPKQFRENQINPNKLE